MTDVATRPDEGARPRLDWLEVGRGLAALGVVCTHLTPPEATSPAWAVLRPLGIYSVEFFFVLSGFIILHVHHRDLDRPAALRHYGWRRSVRIFPTYWFVLAFALLVNQTVQISWARFALSPEFVLRQIFLLPGVQVVGQAWTLRHELLFYGVFALLILNLRTGLVVFAVWMTVVFGNLVLNGLPPGQVADGPGIILLHYNLDFAVGMAVAIAERHKRLGYVIVLGGSAAAILAAIYIQYANVLSNVIGFKLAFGALVALAVWVSRRGIPAPRTLVFLGAMSYTLYLSHEFWSTAVGGLFRRLAVKPPLLAMFSMRFGLAMIGSYLIYRCFDRPVLRRLNGLRFARSSPGQTPDTASPSRDVP